MLAAPVRVERIPGNIIPHSCKYCNMITVQRSTSTRNRERIFTFREVCLAAHRGCRLFQRRLYNLYCRWTLEPSVVSAPPSLAVERCSDDENTPYRFCFSWSEDGRRLFNENYEEKQDDLHVFTPEGSQSTDSRKEKLTFSLGSLASSYIAERPLNPQPSSEDSFRTMCEWMEECRQKHTECRRLRLFHCQQRGPSRLLKVDHEQYTSVSLFQSPNKNEIRYAALSYCWGGEQESKTTCANLQMRLKGWPLESLPTTIIDAIKITRELGLKYIWIDALCIVQDDEEEMEAELAIMSEIYSKASVTIAAARANSVHNGFLHDRNLGEIYEDVYAVPHPQNSDSTGSLGPILLSEQRLDIIYDDPIDLRAWTLQEQLRSLKVIRFGSRQTVWQCAETHHVDGGDNYAHRPTNTNLFTGRVEDKPYLHPLDSFSYKYHLSSIWGNWEYLVTQYTARSLTVISDRLPAFAAIAESFAKVMNFRHGDYYAGLWKFDFLTQLRWRRPEKLPIGKQHMGRTIPSWSWASLMGPVIFDENHLPWGGESLDVLWDQCQVDLRSQVLKYGEVKYAHLAVRGYLRRAYWAGKYLIGRTLNESKDSTTPLPIDSNWDLFEESPKVVWLLEVNPDIGGNSCGLLLTKVHDHIFERVGYFEFDNLKLGANSKGKKILSGQGHLSFSAWYCRKQREIILIK